MSTSIPNPYPRLAQLGIPWHSEPIAHVWPADVEDGIENAGISYELFNETFGPGQTCPVVDDKPALYPWDVESALEALISGHLTGSLHPDTWD